MAAPERARKRARGDDGDKDCNPASLYWDSIIAPLYKQATPEERDRLVHDLFCGLWEHNGEAISKRLVKTMSDAVSNRADRNTLIDEHKAWTMFDGNGEELGTLEHDGTSKSGWVMACCKLEDEVNLTLSSSKAAETLQYEGQTEGWGECSGGDFRIQLKLRVSYENNITGEVVATPLHNMFYGRADEYGGSFTFSLEREEDKYSEFEEDDTPVEDDEDEPDDEEV